MSTNMNTGTGKSLQYRQLALDWQPQSERSRLFSMLLIASLVVMLSLGAVMSSIEVPQKERRAVTPIPERVARFIEQKPKPPEPKPEPPKPKPEPPKPKPRVAREITKKVDEKPLTRAEQDARKKAEETGLLALGNELADLIDTSDIDGLVDREVSSSDLQKIAAGFDSSVLTAGSAAGSGGVDAGQYITGVASAGLSAQERAVVRRSLLRSGNANTPARSQNRSGDRIRPEEEVTIVFDRNKGRLYSLYNRARRSNPDLKGKVVVEITIAPTGTVTNVKILSSELGDPKLESRLLARIKQFTFDAKQVEPVTVIFPIEFLPS